MQSGQRVRVVQNPCAPREDDAILGATGTVDDPVYSRLGYLRVRLDERPIDGWPGLPHLIHPENVVPE